MSKHAILVRSGSGFWSACHISVFSGPRIEQEARKLEGNNFVVNSRFKPFAVRDELLITVQQQYSRGAAAKLAIGRPRD